MNATMAGTHSGRLRLMSKQRLKRPCRQGWIYTDVSLTISRCLSARTFAMIRKGAHRGNKGSPCNSSSSRKMCSTHGSAADKRQIATAATQKEDGQAGGTDRPTQQTERDREPDRGREGVHQGTKESKAV